MKMKTWKFLPIMAMGVCMAMTSCSEDSKKEDVSPNPRFVEDGLHCRCSIFIR